MSKRGKSTETESDYFGIREGGIATVGNRYGVPFRDDGNVLELASSDCCTTQQAY